jgi:thioredoxin-related protein
MALSRRKFFLAAAAFLLLPLFFSRGPALAAPGESLGTAAPEAAPPGVEPGSPGDFGGGLATYGLEEAFAKAAEENKHVFVYFWTDACPYCREFTRTVMGDADIRLSLSRDFVVASLNADRERRLARRFRLTGVPFLVFLDPEGRTASVIPGAVTTDFFLVYLEYVKTMSYTKLDFAEFVESLAR